MDFLKQELSRLYTECMDCANKRADKTKFGEVTICSCEKMERINEINKTISQPAKKLFRLNDDGVTEWFIATSTQEALNYAASVWGAPCLLEYFREYLNYNEGGTIREFIKEFVKEEKPDSYLTLTDEKGQKTTKQVSKWLEEAKECPSFFACEDY